LHAIAVAAIDLRDEVRRLGQLEDERGGAAMGAAGIVIDDDVGPAASGEVLADGRPVRSSPTGAESLKSRRSYGSAARSSRTRPSRAISSRRRGASSAGSVVSTMRTS